MRGVLRRKSTKKDKTGSLRLLLDENILKHRISYFKKTELQIASVKIHEISKALCEMCFVCLRSVDSVSHTDESFFGLTKYSKAMTKETPETLTLKTLHFKVFAVSYWPFLSIPAGERNSHESVWRARVKAICLMITSWVSQMRHPSHWATCH